LWEKNRGSDGNIYLTSKDRDMTLERAKSGMVGEIYVRRWSTGYLIFFLILPSI
jgi:hypothetical protein